MGKTGKKRGASFVLEQVILFMFGIVIFTVCFFVFSSYQSYFTELSIKTQIEEVKDVILYNIVKLSEKDINTTSSIRINFCEQPGTGCLPRRIGGEEYMISLSQKGLNITTVSGASASSNLYNLNETMNMSGSVLSSYGSFLIYKRGNEIILK